MHTPGLSSHDPSLWVWQLPETETATSRTMCRSLCAGHYEQVAGEHDLCRWASRPLNLPRAAGMCCSKAFLLRWSHMVTGGPGSTWLATGLECVAVE